MIIPDYQQAVHYLNYVSYYRLRAYWLPLEQDSATIGDHRFKTGTSFQNAVDLYLFDRDMRLLMIDVLERIEVAIRATWAYHMAMRYGAHGYLRLDIYKLPDRFCTAYDLLKKEVDRSTETFVKHYRKKYSIPREPPVWMASEILSFGQLSQWINNLKYPEDRTAIARKFGSDERIFLSALHHISHIRNICAHHGRLWNKKLTIEMIMPNRPCSLSASMNKKARRNIYNSLCLIKYLLTFVSPTSTWDVRLMTLLDNYSIDLQAMGFPENWKTTPIWQNLF